MSLLTFFLESKASNPDMKGFPRFVQLLDRYPATQPNFHMTPAERVIENLDCDDLASMSDEEFDRLVTEATYAEADARARREEEELDRIFYSKYRKELELA